MSVYFISDFENHKKDDVIFGTTKKNGMHFIKNNVAIILDRKLYKRIIDKNLYK